MNNNHVNDVNDNTDIDDGDLRNGMTRTDVPTCG
jgi:hypothetical protein